MTDKNSGGYHSPAVTIRRLGWLGAVLLLGAALLIPGTVVAAHDGPLCGCSHTSTTSTWTSSSSTESTTSTETSDVSESTQSTQTTETSDVSESTQSTQTTETSDVSESTQSSQTETTTTGTSTSDTGGVGGETGTPDVTPPSTSTLPGSSGSSDGWRVILLGLAGIAVLSLILLPGDRKKSKQR
jgi:hypothetical protein